MLHNSLTEATVVIILLRKKLFHKVENPKNKTVVFPKKKTKQFFFSKPYFFFNKSFFFLKTFFKERALFRPNC